MDRLVQLLERFEMRSRVFQAGLLCRSSAFDAGDGHGYLHVLRAGALRVDTRGEPAREVNEPTVFLYVNPTTHRLVPLGSDTDTVCASFDCGVAHGNPLGLALPGLVAVPLRDAPALAPVLTLLFAEASEDHCGRQAVLDRLAEVVLIHLLRDLMDENRMQIGLLAGLSDPKLVLALNAMHAQPARGWTLAELAATAGMSRARFAAHFRQVVGETPGAYLAQWRLGLSRSLLLKGKPVKLVADEVGYGNASALSRAFTAHMGQSPREWLRERRESGPSP